WSCGAHRLLRSFPTRRPSDLGAAPNPALEPINLSIGEPKHPTPALVKNALAAALDGLAAYPATVGTPALREAIAASLADRKIDRDRKSTRLNSSHQHISYADF